MKIEVPTLKLQLKTQLPAATTTFFVAVYNATLKPVMMSIDDVVAIARGPPGAI